MAQRAAKRPAGRDRSGGVQERRPPVESDALADDPLGPSTVELRYRYHRARRNARSRRQEESRLARYRFYIAMVVLVALAIAFVVGSWHEIQRLFGL